MINFVIGHRFECKGNFYKYGCYYRTLGSNVITDKTFITLGPNVITDETLIMRGSKCYYRWGLYYTWVQLLHLYLLQV